MLLGIDVGSSAVKASLVDPDEGVLSTAQIEVDLVVRHPGWAEADPHQWWAAVCELVPALLRQSGREAQEIEAVATAGMVPAVLALDGRGQPLRNAILQNDARATHEIAELAQALSGVDLLSLTGSALTQQSVAPTLRWLKRYEPDLFEHTETIVGSYDWIAQRMGAKAHVEQNWAIESGLFSLDGARLQEVFDSTEISPQLLPEMRRSGAIVGEVSASAATETGLKAGTPVVVGGADHVSSAYGAGLLTAGDWIVKLGGAGDIGVVCETPLVDERLYLDAHPAGAWLLNGCMATSGSLVRWFSGIVGGACLDQLDAEAQSTPPGSHGVVCLPYFLGEKSPIHDPSLRGAFVGLHLASTRGDLFRSVLEAVAYGFRHHLDVLAERGVTLGPARVTNGGTRSSLWKQILADVLGAPLSPVLGHPGASFGAAIAAGVGTRSVFGWEAIEPLVKLGDPIEPRQEHRARYDELYEVYRELEPALRPISHRLAGGEWS